MEMVASVITLEAAMMLRQRSRVSVWTTMSVTHASMKVSGHKVNSRAFGYSSLDKKSHIYPPLKQKFDNSILQYLFG